MPRSLSIVPIEGIPEIHAGDALAEEIARAIHVSGQTLLDGDVLAVAQKVVSKAEGRVRLLGEVEPSAEARRLASEQAKDPRVIELVLRESRRIVRIARGVIISETHHGFVCANAGVDRSNAGSPDAVVLLPVDPDASATRLRAELAKAFQAQVGVVITDTFGRAWREGHVNVAIGVAGLAPFVRYVGQRDPHGYELRVTEIALADEIAAASELVMGKLSRLPVAIVRGLAPQDGEDGGARAYVRPAERDLFR